MFIIIGLAIVLLLVSNCAEAGDFGVNIQYNTPSSGIANVTPGIDYVYSVDIINTGTNNTGEDINLTVELDPLSIAAGWTVTPSGTTIVPGVEMGAANKSTETITVRAPVDALFEDTATVNISVEVIGHAGEVGAQDSLQLRANVLQVFDVLLTTTQDTKTADPGEMVSFSIRVRNRGNGDDTIVLTATGPELGAWSEPDVTLAPDEFVYVYYNVSVDAGHDTSDIFILLNASSVGDTSGLTYDILPITIHVNPRHEVQLGHIGGDRKDGWPGQTVQFNLTVKNMGTALDAFDIDFIAQSGFQITLSHFSILVESVIIDPVNSTTVVQVYVYVKQSPPVGVGTYYINMTATSQNDSMATDTFSFIVDVQAVYGVSCYSPFSSFAGYPGDTISIDIQIYNDGNWLDYFNIIVDLPPGWTWGYAWPPGNISPEPQEFQIVTIEIYIPVNAASDLYKVNITVKSQNDLTKYVIISYYIEVYNIYSVNLPSSIQGKSVDVGNTAAYSINVQNNGNGPDYIELSLTGDLETWTWLYYNATQNGTIIYVSPPAGGSLDVWLYVNPPLDYWDMGDGTVDLIVNAESLNDPAINPASDTVSIITTVNPVYGVDILSGGLTSGEPGEFVSFLVNVKNTGTATDSYNFNIVSVQGPSGADTSLWFPEIYFSPTSISNLGAGVTTVSTMYVDIPSPNDLYLVPPGTYNITLEVISASDPDAMDTEFFIVNVQQVYVADVQNSVTTKNVNVGSSVQFSITIKNEGNDFDQLSVELEGDIHIPGSVNWGKLSHAGTGQTDVSSLVNILLNAGESTQITLTITVPARNDPSYPTIDPDDVTLRVIVKPSDEDGTEDNVDVTADINEILEYDWSFLAETLDVIPGDPAQFTMIIENSGTGDDTFSYEIWQWEADWSAYGYTFSPSGITIAAGSDDNIALTINTPSDLQDALSGDYKITIRVHSASGNTNVFRNCTVHIEPVYDVDVTSTGSTSKAVNVGNTVTYDFTVRSTGNAQEDFIFEIEDLDTSTAGGGDQSSWADVYLSSDLSTPVSLLNLDSGESETMVLKLTIPDQGDPNFVALTSPLQIRVEVVSVQEPTVRDSFTSTTTVNPVYSFELTSTAPANTKDGEPGGAVQFTLQVRNTGTGTDTYDFRVTSVDEAVFSVGVINSISNLGVDSYGTTTATFVITTDNAEAQAGTYQVQVTADSQHDPMVSRIITLNIQITASAEVVLTPATQSDSGEPGDTIDYVVRVTNEGNAQDTFDLSLTGQYVNWGHILDFSGTTPLTQVDLSATTEPGFFTDIIVRITIPGTGETNADQEYEVTVQAQSRTTEEVFDAASVITLVEQYVDLQLEYSDAGEPSVNYDPNRSPPRFTFKVTNDGNVAEDAISVGVDDMRLTWDFSSPTIDILDPGKSTTFFITFDIPSDEDDDHDLQVFITSSDGSFDSDPVNIRINITKPNLFISNVLGLDNLDVLRSRVGRAITITATVTNDGSASAEDLEVRLLEGNNVIGIRTLEYIGAGDSEDENFRWTIEPGMVELSIIVTPIIETDEGDNEFTTGIIDLRPNLSIRGLNLSRNLPEPGETVTITADVSNWGGNAEDVVVRFFEGTRIIGTDTLDIDNGETGRATLEWEVPDAEGETLTLRADIDSRDSIGDGSQTTESITVGEGTPPPPPNGNLFIIMVMMGAIVGLIAALIVFVLYDKRKRERSSEEQSWDEQPWEEEELYGPYGTGYKPFEPPSMGAGQHFDEYPPPPPPPPPPPETTEMTSVEEKGAPGENESGIEEQTIKEDEPEFPDETDAGPEDQPGSEVNTASEEPKSPEMETEADEQKIKKEENTDPEQQEEGV